MNPDTAPIADVEAWLAPRLGWTKHTDKPGWYHDGKGMSTHLSVLIGPSMDAAIACLPKGCLWGASLLMWWEHPYPETIDTIHARTMFVDRSGDPAKARDELLRLACKAWMVQEENK